MDKKLKGQLKINQFKSEILKNNPLKDPYIRDILVYLPNNYSTSISKRISCSFSVTIVWKR